MFTKKVLKFQLLLEEEISLEGISASSDGMDRTSADYTGMLATIINSLILQTL